VDVLLRAREVGDLEAGERFGRPTVVADAYPFAALVAAALADLANVKHPAAPTPAAQANV